MKLKDYIEDYGHKKVAAMMDVSLTTVYRWALLENAPNPDVAFTIVQKTHGLVDWNDIYQPYFDYTIGRKNPDQLTFEDLK